MTASHPITRARRRPMPAARVHARAEPGLTLAQMRGMKLRTRLQLTSLFALAVAFVISACGSKTPPKSTTTTRTQSTTTTSDGENSSTDATETTTEQQDGSSKVERTETTTTPAPKTKE